MAELTRKEIERSYREGEREFLKFDLTDLDLSGIILQGANFQGADFTGTILEGADLQYSNFNKAILQDTNLRSANLGHTNLKDATLTGAYINQKTKFKNAIMCNGLREKFLDAKMGNERIAASKVG